MNIALTIRRALSLPLLLAACVVPALAARPAPPPPEGQVIVKFKADTSTVRVHALSARADGTAVRSALAARAAALGTRVGRALEAGAPVGERIQVVKASGISAAELARQLAADPEVEYAVPSFRVRRSAAPNDPYYLTGPAVNAVTQVGGPVSGQWYLRAPTATVVSSIDIEAAWARSTGSSNVVVAVLDTGVRPEHPDLSRRLLTGYDFVTAVDVANDGDGRDGDPSDPGDYTTASENSNPNGTFYKCDPFGTGQARATDSSWHGTATASLVGAATNDGVGMAGAAPGVRILPVRVLGKCFGDGPDILAAMRWAAGIHVDGVPDNPNPAKVINMSLGGGECSAAYQDTVNQVIAAGATIVAAAGNSDGGPMEAPATCTGVVGVVALRHIGTKVGFSSLGTQAVIAAPGGNCVVDAPAACQYPILAATNSGRQGPVASTWTDSFNSTVGTSFSSPLVAGVVGLMYSVQPNLTPANARSKLTTTARAFPTSGSGTGVAQCRTPSENVIQDECYCNTTFCGAGMLDAGAAVAAVANSPPVARITVTPAAPTASSPITLSAAGSTPSGNNTITSYQWTLVNGGGIVPGLANGATIATSVTATITPSAAGSFSVQLAVGDGAGNTALATQTVTVAAVPGTGGSSGGGGGGGGGALSLPWLALLALAVFLLVRTPSRRA